MHFRSLGSDTDAFGAVTYRDREEFAERFARETCARLGRRRHIPFDRLLSKRTLVEHGLARVWFELGG